MSNQQIEKISAELGISRYTVKRALDHCPGVSSEVRKQILAAAPQKSEANGCDCDVYVILPEIPAYFWRTLFEALLQNFRTREIKAKYNIYSKLSDTAVAEKYLKEAEESRAKCIIIAAEGGDISSRLSKLAPERCVFSLCNAVAAPNVFFFGSDGEADGGRLGRCCTALLPKAETYLFVGENAARRKGALAIIGDKRVIDLPCTYEDSAADLARRLDPILKGTEVHAIVGLDGISAKIAMALKKCRVTLPFFGFEAQKVEERYGKPAALICQDLPKIAEAVADAVALFLKKQTYPTQKNNFIPSHIL